MKVEHLNKNGNIISDSVSNNDPQNHISYYPYYLPYVFPYAQFPYINNRFILKNLYPNQPSK